MDEKFLLTKAYEVALLSPDPSTQNGAIIVDDDDNILAGACNCFPVGVNGSVKSSPDRLERPKKYGYIEHAERGAVYDAARKGISTKNKIMVVPWFACADCARSIICSGIKLVVGHTRCNDLTHDHWKKSIAIAWEMLKESGVEMRWHCGEVGMQIRFNENLVTV